MSDQAEAYHLAIYDISGIQEYIFTSSKLRDNVGASIIVGDVLKKALPEVMQKVASDFDYKVITEWKERSFSLPFEPDIVAEIIYIGGGNAVIAFRDSIYHEKLNRAFAKRLIELSYTLMLVTTHIQTDFSSYSSDLRELNNNLKQAKAQMLRQRPAGGFPICEQEGGTGFPATKYDDSTRSNISTVQWLKREQARLEFKKALEGSQFEGFGEFLGPSRFAFDMEEMVRSKGEDGYVAVVHIDGNGMGIQLQAAIESYCSKGSGTEHYRATVGFVRRLSVQISSVFEQSFYRAAGNVALSLNTEQTIIPIRPLILDGDDMTFICMGALGVPLAASILQELEGEFIQEEGVSLNLSACAGVALVHSHFPFNIAYEIAEDCCKEAKKKYYLSSVNKGNGNLSCSYIDFHLVQGSHIRELSDIRWELQEGMDTSQSLLARPYRVSRQANGFSKSSYLLFHQLICNMKKSLDGENGAGNWSRTRFQRLYHAHLNGPEQLDLVLEELASRGCSKGQLLPDHADEVGNMLFDALELMDLYDSTFFKDENAGKCGEAAK